MQAVILAGGLGTRLRPFTEKIPKPLIEIAGKPFLSYQLNQLKSEGIKDILLLTGYLGEKIQDYFGDGSNMGLNLSYSKEDKPLGTGGALYNAFELLDDIFFLVNGDTYLEINFETLIKIMQGHGSFKIVLTAFKNTENFLNIPGNLELDKGGIVKGYSKKGGSNFQYIESGIALYKKEALGKKIKCQGPVEGVVFPPLIKEGSIIAYRTNIPFYDMGTAEGIKRLSDFFNRSRKYLT